MILVFLEIRSSVNAVVGVKLFDRIFREEFFGFVRVVFGWFRRELSDVYVVLGCFKYVVE